MNDERPKTPLPIWAKRMLARFKHVRGLSEDEKSLHALGLAATPEERWELVQNHLRLFGSPPQETGVSEQIAKSSRSPRAVRLRRYSSTM